MQKIESFKRYKIEPNGNVALQGTSPKIVDIFGNNFPVTSIDIRVPYRRDSKTVNVKATNLRVRNPRNKSLTDENRCKNGSRKAPFDGGQVDTAHRMLYRFERNGEEVIDRQSIPGKMISPGIEFRNGLTVYICERNGELDEITLLGQAEPDIVAPRILSIERIDGGDIREAGDLIVSENYYCAIDRDPTWVAGTDLEPKVPSTSARNGTAQWYEGTAQYMKLTKNQSGAFSLEIT